jgi:hypothetical protein
MAELKINCCKTSSDEKQRGLSSHRCKVFIIISSINTADPINQ